MAVDMFIKIEGSGFEGESEDHKHKGEIDVLAWSWGVSQSGSFHQGGGGGAGKVNAQDLSLTKYIDKSSPKLMEYTCTGEHIPKATLVVRKAGKKPLEYMKITMEELMVTSVSTGGSGGEDRLTENVSLNFAKIKVEYDEQDTATGGSKSHKEMGYDVRKNEQF